MVGVSGDTVTYIYQLWGFKEIKQCDVQKAISQQYIYFSLLLVFSMIYQ